MHGEELSCLYMHTTKQSEEMGPNEWLLLSPSMVSVDLLPPLSSSKNNLLGVDQHNMVTDVNYTDTNS